MQQENMRVGGGGEGGVARGVWVLYVNALLLLFAVGADRKLRAVTWSAYTLPIATLRVD
jgi:hypothetical protein